MDLKSTSAHLQVPGRIFASFQCCCLITTRSTAENPEQIAVMEIIPSGETETHKQKKSEQLRWQSSRLVHQVYGLAHDGLSRAYCRPIIFYWARLMRPVKWTGEAFEPVPSGSLHLSQYMVESGWFYISGLILRWARPSPLFQPLKVNDWDWAVS